MKPGQVMALAGTVATVVATWPLTWPGEALVQQNVDGYGSAWLIWRAGTAEGLEHLLWIDTLLYAGVAPLLAHLGPVSGFHVASWLGVAMGVWVSEWVAHHRFEVPRPASLAAGLAFGLSPLAGTALTEGHAPMLLGTGLPLLLGALLATPDGRRLRWALWVTLAGCLCALQSGYVGVLAAVLVGVVGAGLRRPLWAVALLASVPAWLYAQEALGGVGMDALLSARGRVAGLVSSVTAADNLAGVPPGADLVFYGVRAPLLWTLLVFGVVVPLVRRDRRCYPLVACGLLAVLLAFGDRIALTAFPGEHQQLRTGAPWGWIQHWVPLLDSFRFPSRFLWIWYLCAGLAAARSFAWLLPRRSGLLVLLLFAETTLVGMRPTAPRRTLAAIPSAYDVLTPEDRVLDVWPWFPESLALRLLNLSCYYQTGHGAQLPHDCLTVRASESPFRDQVEGLLPAMLRDDPPRALAVLAGRGVTHVALHLDAFSPSGQDRLRSRLSQWWGAPLAESRDGGEVVVLYRVRQARRHHLAEAVERPPKRLHLPARRCPEDGMCGNVATRPEPPRDPVPPWGLPALAGLLAGGLVVGRRRWR